MNNNIKTNRQFISRIKKGDYFMKNISPLILVCILTVFSCMSSNNVRNLMLKEEYNALLAATPVTGNAGIPGQYPDGSTVKKYGKLQVIGTRLCDEKGEPVQLRGIYLRALMNESKFLNAECFDTLANQWKINVIRIPFMSDRWYSEPSYVNDVYYENLIDVAVTLSERFGIYCIIDWHVLGDGNPFLHAKESWDFFKRMAYKYGSKTHVIYEICNEPNGQGVTWNDVVKPYARLIIPVIRTGSPDSIVIVGSSTWSQDVDRAAANPLAFKNIVYSFHFYSGSHREGLRIKVELASRKIPLFASEWGNSNYDATGGPFIDESRKWLKLMSKKGISWCHYALTDFDEDAAILKPNASVKGNWSDEDLTPSGRFIVEVFKNP
jgi:endoglucanase